MDDDYIGITADKIQHTNLQGDVSKDKKHFMEISLDGFRLCLSTSEEITFNEFNDSAMKFWTELDNFLQESASKKKSRMRIVPDNMEVG